jgi:hypothetical protein
LGFGEKGKSVNGAKCEEKGKKEKVKKENGKNLRCTLTGK